MKTEAEIQTDNYLEASRGVIKPLLAPPDRNFDLPITKHSEFWQREYCVQIRRYLGLECNCGMNMVSDGWDETIEIWPLTETSFSQPEQECGVETMIGAVCFQKIDYEGIGLIWCMEFCWIHPFYRSRGLLRGKWSHFERKYKTFAVGRPLSKSMEAFLQNVGYPMNREDFIAWLSGQIDESTA